MTLNINDKGQMRSASEGWIKVTILDYRDILQSIPGMVVTRGGVERYKVRCEEGKHKGEEIWVPSNYVESLK